MTRFVLITGGVVSSVGKGVVTSSLAHIFKDSGISVTCIKIDPYLNVDAGTMSPHEHGEVFVLDDGGEVDLDLGSYERYAGLTLTRENNITSGKIFQRIISRERRGDYLGKTVQLIPHATNTIKEWILDVSKIPVDGTGKNPQICFIELGGTPGDIESMMFLESLRHLNFQLGSSSFAHLHVTFIPALTVSGEQKCKPAQQNILDLRKAGLNPQVILCRSKSPLEQKIRKKLSLYGMISPENVLSMPDVENVFEVPLQILREKLPQKLLTAFGMDRVDFPDSTQIVTDILNYERIKSTLPVLRIGLIGKYTKKGSDCYFSLKQALHTASRHLGASLDLRVIDSTTFEQESLDSEHGFHGILIPGGFGNRGIEGKIKAAEFARTKNIPYLGICLGMQIAVIEYARNVLKHKNANSAEFGAAEEDSVVVFMPEIDKSQMGGSMRLGARTSVLRPKSIVQKLYNGMAEVSERHRHRYEVSPAFVTRFEQKGLLFSGRDRSGRRMTAMELPGHRFFVGVQFHPEFKSWPSRPAPVLLGFLKEALSKLV